VAELAKLHGIADRRAVRLAPAPAPAQLTLAV
jgi:hypothetical protein